MFYNLVLDQKHHKILPRQGGKYRHGLIRVKAHDSRAFVASKAFMRGFNGPNNASLPLEITQHLHQVLSQGHCRTGSYNLGNFIAAQQVMPPAKQIPGIKEGGGGGGGGTMLGTT